MSALDLNIAQHLLTIKKTKTAYLCHWILLKIVEYKLIINLVFSYCLCASKTGQSLKINSE
jgi:hypothetical protein